MSWFFEIVSALGPRSELQAERHRNPGNQEDIPIVSLFKFWFAFFAPLPRSDPADRIAALGLGYSTILFKLLIRAYITIAPGFLTQDMGLVFISSPPGQKYNRSRLGIILGPIRQYCTRRITNALSFNKVDTSTVRCL